MTASPVIGILGGMGPAATVDFFRRLVEATPAERDQDHLHILIDNDPSVPDRSEALLGNGPDPTPTLLTMAARLETAGAELLVIPCNTASAFTDAVEAHVGTPVLRWDTTVVAGVRRFRPDVQRVGVLATTGTVLSGIYRRGFELVGIECVEPSTASQRKVAEIIIARKAGVAAADLLVPLASAVDDLLAVGAQEVLIACTELSDIAAAGTGMSYLDAMDLVIKRIIELAGRS
ncbi:MAG: amino acid racemase [Actinomycetota bacterium]|nr:amino acid racemase [Actinomycetota bacterium]